ncbi:hypothetical protein BLOT_015289 [Blomia tropicalis]|nr:hypothetical protein BLOT_015289 [Blomia tropicalis]
MKSADCLCLVCRSYSFTFVGEYQILSTTTNTNTTNTTTTKPPRPLIWANVLPVLHTLTIGRYRSTGEWN